MNYVYDILLNFKEEFYEFYDWNGKDVLDHMRKIPLLKVDTKTIYDFLHYEIKLELSNLEKIENKTELFIGRKIKNIPYAFLLTDTRKVIAVKLQNQKILLSDLLIDEEEVALELCPMLSFTSLIYERGIRKEKQHLKTRKQMETEKVLAKKIESLMLQQNLEKLKYIYYECFNKKCENQKEMIEDMKTELNLNFFHFSKRIEYLLKLTEKTV